MLRHGSLFSGIGGFDLAAEWMGWENVFHCEINEFCNKVLNFYWPNAKSYKDIKQTDFTEWRGKVDIVSGGFPCQPYSLAGKRKGKEDDRHLWPEMLRAIREIQPRWILGENVFGLINWSGGLVFHEVQADLEAEGYEVWPYVLPACAKNAPHRRDRVWFVAYSNSCRNNRTKGAKKGIWKYENKEQQRGGGPMQINGLGNEQDATHSESNGQFGSNSEYEINTSERGFDALDDVEQITLHSNDTRLERFENYRKIERKRKGKEQFFTGSVCNGWEKFPTQSPICRGNDGLSTELVGITVSKHRTESIKGYGNAIVPQLAFEIFKAIEQFENITAA